MSTSPFCAPMIERSADDLQELQEGAVQVTIWAVPGLAFLLFVVASLALNRVDPTWFGLVTALIVLALGTRSALRRGPALAASILTVGLLALFVIALHLEPRDLIAPWGACVVLVASALLGWRWGVTTSAVMSVALFVSRHNGWADPSGESVISVALLYFSVLFTAWVITLPTRVALDWAQNSYRHACSLIQDARERQAELARLSKSLSESYYTLEQLNLELERARRTAEEARHTKAQFAAAVSHELRTPLNLIIGFCEMMVLPGAAAYTEPLPSEYREDLETIYRNACHISALVDDILDLSQIDADRMALHREWTSLKQIVDEAVAPVATLFRNRGLSLQVTLAEDLPSVYVDGTRIRQILINLLSNAARLTDVGGATVRAWREDESVVLSVFDTGPGIVPEELPYVFEEFHQAGDLRQRHGGSGLGLAVSKRFAELHQGEIWVESAVGQGTAFFLRLPITPQETTSAPVGPSWGERLANRVRGKAERSVLIVDDSDETIRTFQRYLDGYRVLTIADLYKPEKARGCPFCAVVVGSDAARERWRVLAQAHSRWQQVPVILCTWRTNRTLALNFGAADYLVKPISRERLRGALRCLNRNVQTVLVVEDDGETRRLLSRMVRSLDWRWRVATAENGEQALASMRVHLPDVVLLDLLMPTRDGYSVLTEMRADSRLCNVPVLIITAKSSENQTMVAEQVALTHQGGLSVAELMRWLSGGLTALQSSNGSDGVHQAASLA